MADASLFDIFMSGAATECAQATSTVSEISKDEVALDAAKAIAEADKPIIDSAAVKLQASFDTAKAISEADKPILGEMAKPDETMVPEKKPRKPRASKKGGVKKAHHDKTAKEATQDKVAQQPQPQTESRHSPGYSMLRVERDKIERSRMALMRKNENRAAQGKPAPTVCSILNDRLIEFYADVANQFDTRFGKYLKN